ncbi:MAG: DNA ligase [Pseudomonadota bacterium]|nr:DNA ligase [Pseudomonadota bacterium]
MPLHRRHFLASSIAAWALTRAAGVQAQLAQPAASGTVINAANPPPMQLAGRYHPGLRMSEWWVSEKYDGVRAWWDGHTLWTRGGRRITPPDAFTSGWPRVALDGELWAGPGQFDQVQSAVARYQPDDAAWQALRFMVFDLPTHGGVFDARLAALQATLPKVQNPALQAVEQRKLASHAELQALLREVVKAGGEGLMLHRASAEYHAGRSTDLLKLKDHDDAEARVLRHIPGQGRHAGRMGALLVETPEGKRFRLGTGFTDAQRAQPPAVGRWVTYRYQGLHADSGLPRFARFVRVREDAPLATQRR